MIVKDKVSILFSGGSDSTLAAALMCKQFEKVYLLTFYHSGLPFAENAKINARRLAQKYGKEKIKHELINFEDLFKRLFYGNYLEDLRKYKTFMTSCLCNACQLAMHSMTIIFNIDNDIHFTCDGYKKEKRHIWIFMAEKGIKELKKFYKSFGIEYNNPVYNIIRTDWKLFEMGITSRKNVKFPSEGVEYTNQHRCRNGILVNTYLMGYFFPIYGYKANINISLNYWLEKLEILKKYISKKLRLIEREKSI